MCLLRSSQLPVEFRRDVRMHQGANGVLVVYAITNYIVSLNDNGASSMTQCVTLELLGRCYFIYKLEQQLDAQRNVVERLYIDDSSDSDDSFEADCEGMLEFGQVCQEDTKLDNSAFVHFIGNWTYLNNQWNDTSMYPSDIILDTT